MDSFVLSVIGVDSRFLPTHLGGVACSYRRLERVPDSFSEKTLPDAFLVAEKKAADLLECFTDQRSGPFPIVSVVSENEVDIELACRWTELGAVNVLSLPLNEISLYSVLNASVRRRQEMEFLTELVSRKERDQASLAEKGAILEAILDILSHDTKNLFIHLEALVDQVEQGSLKGMLIDTIGELRNGTAEAMGYLGERKRIYSLLEELRLLKIGRERRLIETHPRISIEHDSSFLLYVEASALIRNALVNLIENALKYTPEDSPVKIELRRVGGEVLFRVSDSGAGIPDDEKERIFERSYRREATKQTEGSGRGLWICRTVVRKEGGQLTVEDNPGGGAVFSIRLPAFRLSSWNDGLQKLERWFGLSREDLLRKRETMEVLATLQHPDFDGDLESIIFANLLQYLRNEKESLRHTNYKGLLTDLKRKNPRGVSILIADDSLHVHYYMATHLTELGFRVAEYARNGVEAVSNYRAMRPQAVTMDCTMPRMSGIEAAKQIYAEDPEARILFVTGLGDHEGFRGTLQDLFGSRSYSVITKPFSRETLSVELGNLGLG